MALPPDDPPPGVPEWVVTYGDMMSLLLTFFIMLVSMAEMKQDGKMRLAMDAMKEQFGPTAGRSGVPGKGLAETGWLPKAASEGSTSEGGTKKNGVDSKGLGGPSRSVERLGHGTQITLGGPALFEPLQATLTDQAKADLETLAKVLGPRPNRIVIRGHATRERGQDGQSTQDPWSLSFARARAGAEYLVSLGIDRHRLAVAAAGDSEPRTVSRDPNVQKANRRIDVFVIDAYTTPAEKPVGDAPASTSAAKPRP